MSLLTAFDAIDVVYQHLASSPVKDAITGNIYKLKRPINATDEGKEDIVINSLGLPNKDIQQGIVNVNIYVPNLSLQINNRQDHTQQDFIRAKQLVRLVIEQLQEFYSGEYFFLYQQDNPLQSEEGESATNIRVDFFSINL